MLTPEINSYLDGLLKSIPSIESIWLIGSRANGTAKPGSDWDFLVFGDDTVFEKIQNSPSLCMKNVDLLIVAADGGFKTPYGEEKSGHLESWKWRTITSETATYKSSKFDDFDPDGDGYVGGNSPFKIETLKAVRVKGA